MLAGSMAMVVAPVPVKLPSESDLISVIWVGGEVGQVQVLAGLDRETSGGPRPG